MKKLVSLLLACCMLLSLSAAFAEEKVELTAFQYALENQNTDFNGLWFFEENQHPRHLPDGEGR